MASKDPQLMKSYREHKDKITETVFTPNMRQIVSSSTDGVVLATVLKANSRANKFIGHKGPVHDVAVNPASTLIASASRDTTIRVWNNTASARNNILKGHSAPVKSVEFNNDGRLLISGSDDKLIKIWDVENLKFVQSFSGHQNWVKSAQFSSDSRMVASGSDDRTVRIWDVTTGGKEIVKFTDHTGMVNKVKFHPDSTCLASCGTDKKIKIFDCRSHRLLQHYDAHDDVVNSISFNAAGTHLISSSNDATVKIWDLRKGCILYTLYGHENASTSASFSPMGDYFLSGGADSVVLAWRSNLNQVRNEDIEEIQAKINTEVFITQKEKVDKLPSQRGTKQLKKPKKAASTLASQLQEQSIHDDTASEAGPPVDGAKAAVQGITYRKLKPEVKNTLEKVLYQLELISKTLQLLEVRIVDSEDKLQNVMTQIKNSDIDFQPQIVNSVLNMNKYDEVSGVVRSEESHQQKQFGNPLPGDPSIMYTLQKNTLPELQQKFANTVQVNYNVPVHTMPPSMLQTGKFRNHYNDSRDSHADQSQSQSQSETSVNESPSPMMQAQLQQSQPITDTVSPVEQELPREVLSDHDVIDDLEAENMFKTKKYNIDGIKYK